MALNALNREQICQRSLLRQKMKRTAIAILNHYQDYGNKFNYPKTHQYRGA
jgi:hypothetical protein